MVTCEPISTLRACCHTYRQPTSLTIHGMLPRRTPVNAGFKTGGAQGAFLESSETIGKRGPSVRIPNIKCFLEPSSPDRHHKGPKVLEGRPRGVSKCDRGHDFLHDFGLTQLWGVRKS